jgi:hypothetical protein
MAYFTSGPAYRASLFHGALGLKRWTKSIPIVNTLVGGVPLVVTQENPRTREKKNEKGSALTSVDGIFQFPARAYRASLFHGALGLKRWTKSIPIVNTLVGGVLDTTGE